MDAGGGRGKSRFEPSALRFDGSVVTGAERRDRGMSAVQRAMGYINDGRPRVLLKNGKQHTNQALRMILARCFLSFGEKMKNNCLCLRSINFNMFGRNFMVSLEN
jgi:hypothetical protein